MAYRQREPGIAPGPRKKELPPPPWDEVAEQDDETRLLPRKSVASQLPLKSQTLTRIAPAEKTPAPTPSGRASRVSLPWNAREEALQLVSGDLPILPRVPFIPVVTQPGYVPPPPPLADPFEAPHRTSSLRAPEDQALPRHGAEFRTTFSNEAALIADLLRTRFGKRRYGTVHYRLRIDEPGGPSTAGGRLARQSLSLVARKNAAPAIVCGWVDVAKKEAQLRSYGMVVKRQQRHHGSVPALSAQEYERFLQKLMHTLFEGGIRLVLHVPDEQESQQAPTARRSPLLTVLGVLGLVALGFVLGMNAERLAPWFEQASSWLGPTWALTR